MREWHNLIVDEKAAALRIAGFQVTTNVSFQLMAPNVSVYAVADYIFTAPNLKFYVLSEVKTGNGQLTPNQVLNYKSGLAQVLSGNAGSIGLNKGDIIGAAFNGIDRFPGCP